MCAYCEQMKSNNMFDLHELVASCQHQRIGLEYKLHVKRPNSQNDSSRPPKYPRPEKFSSQSYSELILVERTYELSTGDGITAIGLSNRRARTQNTVKSPVDEPISRSAGCTQTTLPSINELEVLQPIVSSSDVPSIFEACYQQVLVFVLYTTKRIFIFKQL